jgi:RNA polymerase sigma-70 factor (ECF subfamily)
LENFELLTEPGLNIEKAVILQFISGSGKACELIFHRTKGKLKGFLKKALPKDEDVESVMQDVYLKLWATRKFIQPDKNFETYLFTIARNLVIDIMRKRLHKQKYIEDLYRQLKEKQRNSLDTNAVVEYSELEKKIFELIDQLPEKRREIFKLNRLEGLTYKEIAAKLKISENTVDSQMRKALAYFHLAMEHYLGLIIWWYLHQ